MNSHCVCHRTRGPIMIDGRLEEEAWKKAAWSPRFADMVTGQPGWYDTRAAALWDDTALYVAFRIEEPYVEATLTERDSLVFTENDVELFIDGGDSYYELEVNALGTLYEVYFVWQDAMERFAGPAWDPVARKALTFGGDYDRTGTSFWHGTHRRGLRWAFRDWDFPGLRSAVQVDGPLNDRSAAGRGWTVELALPWAGMSELAAGRSLPPRPGDSWRMFFGRFEKLLNGGREVTPHPAWCWTPHGLYDTHQPESWTPVLFDAAEAEGL